MRQSLLRRRTTTTVGEGLQSTAGNGVDTPGFEDKRGNTWSRNVQPTQRDGVRLGL
jgi:hypothetical protein